MESQINVTVSPEASGWNQIRQLPVNMNGARAIDTLGVMVFTCAAHQPFYASIESASFPLLLVLNGPLKVDSAMDTFLTTVLQLDVHHESYGSEKVKLWMRKDAIRSVLGVFLIGKRLPPVLAAEFAFASVVQTWPVDSLVMFEAGVSFPAPTQMRRTLRQLGPCATTMFLDPEQSSHFTSMGSVLSFHTRKWLDWVSRRPYQIQCSMMGQLVDDCFPLLIAKRKVVTRSLMTDLGTRYHPCHDSFGSLASLVPTHFWNKSGVPALIDAQSIAKISIQSNDHHITQMVLDRQNWFVEMVWPFKNIYRIGKDFGSRAVRLWNRCSRLFSRDDDLDDDEDGQEERSSRFSCFQTLGLLLMSFLQCGVSIVDLFVPSIMVLLWLDLIPFVTPVANWAEDALLVAHAFVLRTTVVSWSEVRPWNQAWIHWILMIFFFLLDFSTFGALTIVWIEQGMELQYKLLFYSMGARLFLSMVDSWRLGSKSMMSWKTWACTLLTLPWVLRTSPIYSMLHVPRRIVPYAHKNRKMYSLQESLVRKRVLENYATFRTWIIITWSVLNASLLSVQRFLKDYGDFTSRYPARVLAICLAGMHLWACLWILVGAMTRRSKKEKEVCAEPWESIDLKRQRGVNPIEHKVAKLIKKPYEQRAMGYLAATGNFTQTTSEQVGTTHRQVHTIVTMGAKFDNIL